MTREEDEKYYATLSPADRERAEQIDREWAELASWETEEEIASIDAYCRRMGINVDTPFVRGDPGATLYVNPELKGLNGNFRATPKDKEDKDKTDKPEK